MIDQIGKNIKRPWGSYTIIHKGNGHWVKIIEVGCGRRTSLQQHRKRSEIWIILQGSFNIHHGKSKSSISIYRRSKNHASPLVVRRGDIHRLEGLGNKNVLLEIALGRPDENDIIRHEDDYGRVGKK